MSKSKKLQNSIILNVYISILKWVKLFESLSYLEYANIIYKYRYLKKIYYVLKLQQSNKIDFIS